jgi:hypothetical protein
MLGLPVILLRQSEPGLALVDALGPFNFERVTQSGNVEM